jgi:hypothetical protein
MLMWQTFNGEMFPIVNKKMEINGPKTVTLYRNCHFTPKGLERKTLLKKMYTNNAFTLSYRHTRTRQNNKQHLSLTLTLSSPSSKHGHDISC